MSNDENILVAGSSPAIRTNCQSRSFPFLTGVSQNNGRVTGLPGQAVFMPRRGQRRCGATQETGRTAFNSPVKKDKTQASKSRAVRPVADTPQIASWAPAVAIHPWRRNIAM